MSVDEKVTARATAAQDGGGEVVHPTDYCPLCKREVVVCAKCGNNTCNGGYGALAGGKDCDLCPSAYEQQARAEGSLPPESERSDASQEKSNE